MPCGQRCATPMPLPAGRPSVPAHYAHRYALPAISTRMGVESGAAAKYREVPFVGASDLPKHADDIRRIVLVPLWFQPRRGEIVPSISGVFSYFWLNSQ